MGKGIEKLHILSAFMLNITLLILSFITNNPFVILSVFSLCFVFIFISGNFEKISKSLVLFIPMAVITIVINMVFTSQGRIVLFRVLSKNFTLESLIYALILSFKLLLIMFIFILFTVLIDSDNAVAYFSKHVPKSTLVMLISMKLFPNMKRRFEGLKQIYSIRGVDYEGKTIKDKVKSYIPIINILLEDSLEGSFDIGEAAYVRGFLSSKRSTYDKQPLYKRDFVIILFSIILLGMYVSSLILASNKYDVYTNISLGSALDIFIYVIIFIHIVLLLLLTKMRNKL